MKSIRLRTTVVLLLTVLVGVFIYGKFLEVSFPVKAASEGKKSGLISVNGEGKIKVEPNVVKAEIGVETEAKTAEKAQSENAQKMKQVIVVLKRSGIASQDIQTSEFFLEPDYEEDSDRQVIVGYHAINYVSVEVKEVGKFGEILDKAVKAGANGARSISFSVTDSKAKQLRREARKQAVKEARDKAEELAKLTGVRVGKPTSISESQVSSVYEQSEVALKAAGEESVPIETGQVEIVLNVQITYELLTD